jgi:hypothetical protein
MKFKQIILFAQISLVSLAVSAPCAMAQLSAPDTLLLKDLARISISCAEQPYKISQVGKKVYSRLRSHCKALRISEDRAELRVNGHIYALVLKDNELADEGDIGDLYLQFDAREDQEVLIQNSVLAFGDPVLALLLVSGESPEQVREILESNPLF